MSRNLDWLLSLIPPPIGEECVIWEGRRNQHDYGMWAKQLVSRLIWEKTNGPIPDGLCVCHQCDNPPCVRLDHFFLGTADDNVQDRKSKGRGLKTHCKRGHEFTPENTVFGSDGARRCLTCDRERRKMQGAAETERYRTDPQHRVKIRAQQNERRKKRKLLHQSRGTS